MSHSYIDFNDRHQQSKLMIRHQHIKTVAMINSSTSLQSVTHWLILKIKQFSLNVFALGKKWFQFSFFIFSPTIASNRFFVFRRIEKRGRNELIAISDESSRRQKTVTVLWWVISYDWKSKRMLLKWYFMLSRIRPIILNNTMITSLNTSLPNDIVKMTHRRFWYEPVLN